MTDVGKGKGAKRGVCKEGGDFSAKKVWENGLKGGWEARGRAVLW